MADYEIATPFATASTAYSNLSTALTALSQQLAALPVEGSGTAITALVNNVERRAQLTQEMAQEATTVSDVCADQAGADVELSSAVSTADSARESVLDAQRGLANGTGTPEDVQAAVDSYNDANSARNEARRVHEEATAGTQLPDTQFPSSTPGAPSTGTPSDSNEMSGSSSSGGGGDVSSSGGSSESLAEAGDTELSSDTAAPMGGSPMLAQTPMAQAPAAGGTPQPPQMAPMQPQAPMGATPSTAAKDRTDTAQLARDRASRSAFGAPRLDTSIGTQTSGASGDTDRGSSNSGTSTRADTSGSSKTALSGSTAAAPGTAAQQGQGMMRGGGMMGGMGGGMMGGQGGSGNSKERPQILTTDPDLLGTEDESNSVASGILGRDTASDPNKDR